MQHQHKAVLYGFHHHNQLSSHAVLHATSYTTLCNTVCSPSSAIYTLLYHFIIFTAMKECTHSSKYPYLAEHVCSNV